MTAGDTPEAEPSAVEDAEAFDRLVGIYRAGRMESACSAWDHLAQESVVERQGLLIGADENQNQFFHNKMVWHVNGLTR